MAHQIEYNDKQQGTTQAWHGLTEVRDSITLDDNWLTQWDYVPVILQKNGQDSKYRVLECTDKPGLEVGTAYNSETFRPINNVEFLGLIRDSINGSGHKIVSVGSVRNRGRVFVSIEFSGNNPGSFKAAGRDFKAFLNFGHGNDKSSVLWVNTSNTCTVCDNTFSMNLFSVENARRSREGDHQVSLRQRHTPKAIFRFPNIAGLVSKAIGAQVQFAEAFDKFDKVAVSTQEAREIFAGLISRPVTPVELKEGLSTRAVNKTDRLVELFLHGAGNRGETLADAVSAVTDYYTHESVRSGDKFRQFASSEFETGASVKSEFFALAQKPLELEAVRSTGAALLTATK
jgi:hypothetical protein